MSTVHNDASIHFLLHVTTNIMHSLCHNIQDTAFDVSF